MVHFRSHRSILGHLGTLLAILGIFGCLDHFGSHLTTLDQFGLQLFGPLWSILVSFGSPWSIFLATGPSGVAALVPVSEEVCRSVDVYQRGKLLTLELKTGTLLKFGVRFKVTLVVVNLLWNIGNVIWVEAYHYFQVILLIIGGNFIHNLVQKYQRVRGQLYWMQHYL